jgi:hypothetical protein
MAPGSPQPPSKEESGHGHYNNDQNVLHGWMPMVEIFA